MAYKKCLIATTKNLFDKSRVIKGFELDSTHGTTIANLTWFVSDYISVVGINTLTISGKASGGASNCFYDNNHNFISTVIMLNGTFQVPSGATYMRFNGLLTEIDTAQLEKGSTATSYVPYGYLPSYKKLIKVNNDPVQSLDKSKYRATHTINGVTFTNNGDGSFTVNGTATARAAFTFIVEGIVMSGGDKICFHKPLNVEAYNKFWCEISVDYTDGSNRYFGDIYNTVSKIEKDAHRIGGFIVVAEGETVNATIKPQLFNLTTTYGAGHEPTTVAEFRAKYPNDYYEYNPSQYLISYRKNLITDGSSKNLFDIPLTQGYPSNKAYGADTKRTFTIGTYITGFARNNYYDPDNVTNVNVSKGIISFKVVNASAYGIGIPILLTAGQTYTASCLVDNNVHPGIGISYYKEDGTPISYTQVEMVTNNPIVSFTIPEGTYFTVVVLYGRSNNNYVFSNIQLEKGNTATSYVPYQYL